MPIKNASQQRREMVKQTFWPDEIAWTGDRPEKGWLRAPRTLPVIMLLLRSKAISGKQDPSGVYLELHARHRDSGIVEMVSEAEHSYAAGYPGPRGIRSWQERMKILEHLGFIKSKKAGNQMYKNVLLMHPAIVVQKLYEDGKVDKTWWDTYRQMQIDSKESTYEQLMARHAPVIAPAPPAKVKVPKVKLVKKAS